MRFILILAALSLLLLAVPACAEEEDFNPDYSAIPTGVVLARVACHDPSIVAADGKYYIFGSHMVAAVSQDLRSWSYVANGYSPSNKVWGNIFEEGLHVFDYAGNASSLIPTDDRQPHVWAPDVIYNPVMGKYMMYYCTSSTWNASNLCFGISDSIEGPYTWQARLICSGFDKNTISGTNVADYADDAWIKSHYLTLAGTWNYRNYPNAIDPSIFFDADGRFWMVYGSWSGGIFLLELDPATGLVIHPEADEENNVDPYFGRKLLGGGHQSIEGPYILYDQEAGWYYLFVSYGELTSNGGYQIRVFRSRTPDGDYEDMNGDRPRGGAHQMYGLKLSGNYMLPSLRRAYMATGHNSAFIDTDGKRYVVCHTRFDDGTESHVPLVRQYALNEEGWPCILPYATRQEDIPESFDPAAVAGRYYVINQGIAINARIANPFILYLREDGTVSGEDISGTWTLSDSSVCLHLDLGGTAYSGVICRMRDNGNTEVTVFSAVGKNESVWGVKYDQ